MDIIEKTVLSSDGVHSLKGKIYLPEGEIKGYYQIVHGMAEHIGRYDAFMRDLAGAGYIAFGYDHLGHGKTASKDELGFIASVDGWKYLCRDVNEFALAVMSEYGEMPLYLMGHSMGSFIVRIAVTLDASPNKLIIMGTGGSNPAASVGIKLCGLIGGLFGKKHISPFVNKMAFGAYNKRFPGEDKNAWLSCDALAREKYAADPLSGYDFTVSAMADLMTLNKEADSEGIYEKTPRTMEILLVSGTLDPVGDYGDGVRSVCEKYRSKGCSVQMKLYEDHRHEILNDSCYERVLADILSFIE